MFTHLRTKLTVLYAALFLAALAVISAAVYAASTRNAEQLVRDQIVVSGTVFDNLSATHYRRLQDEAEILAHDFGFISAVATHDDATVDSALDNLAARSGIDLAFMITPNGLVKAQDKTLAAAVPQGVVKALQVDGTRTGVFMLNGAAYEAVAAPIMIPDSAGWVVFATVVGPKAMKDLTRLSALPLRATVLGRDAMRGWAPLGGRRSSIVDGSLGRRIEQSLASQKAETFKLDGADAGSTAFIERLPAFGHDQQIILMLSCPLADALKPYRALAETIFIIGLLGMFLLVLGSWVLAQTLTRPISALEEAVRRLQRGEPARVVVETGDEIARLGLSFNAMADTIQERESSLTQARDVAEAASRAKSVFLANMNHEVRTPLNGVLGVAGVLSGTDLNAEQRRMVDLIETSGAALQRILSDVLVMVDLSSDQLELADLPFDLGAVLRGLADAASMQAHAKRLTFELALDEGADRWVRGDPERIEQILINLLDNAVKFTEQGVVGLLASIDAGTEGEAAVFRFEVRDTGVGFNPARLEELFMMFSQADGSLTRKVGGTGLGLSLARDLARAMGGDITGDSAPGGGAAFALTLPLILAAPSVRRPQPGEPATTRVDDASNIDEATTLKILVADDHAANRTVIELILGALEVEVVSVKNGAEAVDAFKAQAFDVVLMDLQMPVMDGITAIKLIRAHERVSGRPRTPILVISANVQSAHLKASAEAGADSHLAKPILAPTLIAALEEALAPPDDTAPALARTA